jgi:hypothetical protein
MPMRSVERRIKARLVIAAAVVAAGPVLSACMSSSTLDSLDPTEWFDTKKKLAGDRKPVFPEGVPGVSSGVPPELVRGYREPEGGTVDPAKAAAAQAAAEDKPVKPVVQRTAAAKPKPKPKPVPQQAAAPAPAPPVQGGGWSPPQQAPWPGSR